jgi:Uma2 family endonuclease
MYFYTTEPIPREEMPAYFFDEQGNFVYPETYTEEEIANFPEDFMPQTDVHLQWISTIKGNLQSIFRKQTDVYVAGDIYCYLDENQPNLRVSPDVMVAFGRTKEDRNSYKVWEEAYVVPQVVFEVLSKSNSKKEMKDKFLLYEKYGVQEYYVYNPQNNQFYAWLREIQSDKLRIYRPAGTEFVTFVQQDEINEALQAELDEERFAKEQALRQAEQERTEKEQALRQAEQERLEKEQERKARLDAEVEERQAQEEERRAQFEAEELRKVLASLGYDFVK